MINKIFSYCIILLALLISPVKANYADNISINTKEENAKKVIEYVVTYTVENGSSKNHGIYLNLEKIQDNVAYEYTLKDKPTKNGLEDKYQLINEITSYRIKIGDPNVENDPGTYIYKFSLITDIKSENKHNFNYISNWTDNINSTKITKNGIDNCISPNICSTYTISELINPDKNAASRLQAYITVFQGYIWALGIALLSWFGFLKKKLTDPFKSKILKELPHYTPPTDITPWQAESLIQNGDIEPKLTINAYVFYLYNKGYLSINTDPETKLISLNKLKELPNDLGPIELNLIVESLISNGMKTGIEDSGITYQQLDSKLDYSILDMNKKYYMRNPILYPYVVASVLTIVLLVLLVVFNGLLRDKLNIGNSITVFIAFIILLIGIIFFFIIKMYHKFTPLGFQALQESTGYKYYINYIEKEKLDFDNNPTEGLKQYLNALPYAAQFGMLEQFNNYFKSKKFFNPEVANQTWIINQSIINTSFYVTPINTDSGFSSGGGGFDGGGGGW